MSDKKAELLEKLAKLTGNQKNKDKDTDFLQALGKDDKNEDGVVQPSGEAKLEKLKTEVLDKLSLTKPASEAAPDAE